ncbi:Amino acid transporter protein, partial [Operophtera brumata]
VKTSQQLCIETKKPALGYADTCDLVSDAYGGPEWSVTVFCGLTLVVLVPLTQITKLKYLVPFSAIANFGIGVVMPLENEMQKPQHFLGCPGVLNLAMSTVVVLYGFVGFVGYMSFGEGIGANCEAPCRLRDAPFLRVSVLRASGRGVEEDTGSSPGPEPPLGSSGAPACRDFDYRLAQTAKLLVACVMLLSFALVYYVPVDVVWRRIQDRVPARNHRWAVAGLRLAGTLIIVFVIMFVLFVPVGLGSAIPRLELFMELVGAVCLSVMGLLLPSVVETVWRWDKDLTPFHWVVWKNAAISVFSLVAMVSGVAYAIIAMIEK